MSIPSVASCVSWCPSVAGPLSPNVDREALHSRFKDCAPFQVRFLQDWGSGQPSGVAMLELTDSAGEAE